MAEANEELEKELYAGVNEELEKELYAEANEELQKELYGGVSASPDFKLKYGDSASKAPQEKNTPDFSGRNSDSYELKYGEPGDEPLDLDWIYSQDALKVEHVRRIVNLNIEENERFAHEVVFPEEQGVVPSLRPPTKQEWTHASEKDRTEWRRGYYRESAKQVQNVISMQSELKSAFDNGTRLLSANGLQKYNVLKKSHDTAEAIPRAIKEVVRKQENTKSSRGGWSSKEEVWKPHTSVEGGTETVAYGHKLTPSELNSGTISIGGQVYNLEDGIPDKVAIKLFERDWEVAMKKAQAVWSGFDELKPRDKALITELAFNVKNFNQGNWPKLAQAIDEGDTKEISKQIMRSYTDADGNTVPLSRRVNAIREVAFN